MMLFKVLAIWGAASILSLAVVIGYIIIDTVVTDIVDRNRD